MWPAKLAQDAHECDGAAAWIERIGARGARAACIGISGRYRRWARVSWGAGTLVFEGKSYNLKVTGFAVGDVGLASIDATGCVYNWANISDFAGNYAAAGVGGTFAGGWHNHDYGEFAWRCHPGTLHHQGPAPQSGSIGYYIHNSAVSVGVLSVAGRAGKPTHEPGRAIPSRRTTADASLFGAADLQEPGRGIVND